MKLADLGIDEEQSSGSPHRRTVRKAATLMAQETAEARAAAAVPAAHKQGAAVP